MEQFFILLLRALRGIYWKLTSFTFDSGIKQTVQYPGFIELRDQAANDYVGKLLSSGNPCLISKFGEFEIKALEQYRSLHQDKYSVKDLYEYIIHKRTTLWWPKGIDGLCHNAGFFPNDFSLLGKYYQENIKAVKQIDVLGSYLKYEYYFQDELKHAKKINLDGYYAPFLYNNPWTRYLKGKRVLVIHPFNKDIECQYQRREKIWEDQDILPQFTLITYKSVQSMLGIKTPYDSWFDALEKMKRDVEQIDFDIALVGCGAYGMPLAAHIKELGKQAVHLAGWTQVLFGILGRRWEDDTRMKRYINQNWIHPSPEEIPTDAKEVEGGCYW